MPDKNKKTWTVPQITCFTEVEEAREHYKGRGSPEERARLEALLQFAVERRTRSEPKRRRA